MSLFSYLTSLSYCFLITLQSVQLVSNVYHPVTPCILNLCVHFMALTD